MHVGSVDTHAAYSEVKVISAVQSSRITQNLKSFSPIWQHWMPGTSSGSIVLQDFLQYSNLWGMESHWNLDCHSCRLQSSLKQQFLFLVLILAKKADRETVVLRPALRLLSSLTKRFGELYSTLINRSTSDCQIYRHARSIVTGHGYALKRCAALWQKHC